MGGRGGVTSFSYFGEIFHYVHLKIDVSITCGNFGTRFLPLFSAYRILDTTQYYRLFYRKGDTVESDFVEKIAFTVSHLQQKVS